MRLFLTFFFFIVDDFYFMKSLSRAGIYTIIRKHGTDINLRRFLSTDAWGLGVVVDLRCRNKSAVTIFAEVKGFYTIDTYSFISSHVRRKKERRDWYFISVQTSKYRMYDYSYHWLALGSKLDSSIPLLNDSAYGMTTDFVLAITNSTGYDLYDIYNHCKYRGGTLNVTMLGLWRPGKGLTITLTQSLIERRANMHGMTLKISGVVRIVG